MNNNAEKELSHILSEENFLLIGATTFLGFQFSVIFSSDFFKLPQLIQYIHFGSLYVMGLAVILLFTPIARHRVGHKGKFTNDQTSFAHIIFKCAMIFFALGVSFEVFASHYIMFRNYTVSTIGSVITFAIFLFFWFGFPILVRNRK